MGRVKQYDEQEVLDKAMLSFWKHGYKETTIRQLESDMGINQFSIYAAFKNKDELYRRVLINYEARLDRDFLSDLKKQDASLLEVNRFLQKFALSIHLKQVPNSCLMVRSVSLLDSLDPAIQKIVITFFKEMKVQFKKALENSIKQNLLPNTLDIEVEAEYLIGIAQSISVYSKLKSKAQIKRYITNAIGKIK